AFLVKKAGVKIFLVSANAFPIVFGIARYLGFDGVVAENGCIVARIDESVKRPQIKEICRESFREAAKIVAEKLPALFRESWQNDFRKFDFALEVLNSSLSKEEIVSYVKQILEKEGFHDKVDVNYSGYAVHLTPRGAGKLNGLKILLSMFDLGLEEIVGIGDSIMDWDFIREVGIKVSVANGDPELRERVEIVTDYDSGYGFAQLCKTIAEAKLVGK
ncbi:MAG: HAD hydrolase family protein, partial [Fervidicoccaceae archaeon]